MFLLGVWIAPALAVAVLGTGVAASVGPSAPVIAAAGDIACDPANSNFSGGNGANGTCRQRATSDLMVNKGLAAVLTLGDNQYYCGSYRAHLESYDLSWGRLKSITRPVVGNHEYITHSGSGGSTDCDATNAGAAGYWDYFNGPGQSNGLAGVRSKGYYSFDVGSWHLIALNSNCGDVGGCSSSTEQGQWLKADLAAHPDQCTLAYWHIPLFSSGGRQASNSQSFWTQLQAAGADVILGGHDHIYERFAPQRPDGTPDAANGIRSFIVGTGGANHTSMAATAANSEVRHTGTYGVLMLTLNPTSYEWRFQPEAGSSFTDSGSDPCHRTGGGADSTAPSAPTGLGGTAVSPSRVNLSWNGSTDNVGVSGYRIMRGGSEIGTSSSTSYSDTAAQPGSPNSYHVIAYDAAGNTSGASNTATVTTPVPPDTTAPTAPSGLSGTAASSSRVNLSWNGSTDNVGVSGYRIMRGGSEIGTSSSTSYSDTAAQPGSPNSYHVIAYDAAGNTSGASNTATVTTPAPPDTTAPTAPAALAGTAASSSRVNLTWTRSTDNVGVSGYRIFREGAQIGTTASASYSDSAARPAAPNSYHVIAYDAAGNTSAASNTATVTTPAPPDTTAPTAPSGLSGTAASTSQVNLTWNASADNVGVSGYRIFRDGGQTGTSTSTSYADTALQPGSAHSYYVVAYDAAGNSSGSSNTVVVTTMLPPPPPPPPPPPGPPAGGQPFSLSFTPSDDATVAQSLPTTNFGATPSLEADGSPVSNSLLRFVVSGVGTGSITSAKLRLFCVNPSSSGGQVRGTGGNWQESSVTWSTAPSAGSTGPAALGSVSSGQWYEFDVTQLVTGDGVSAFRIANTATDGADYASKETVNRPQLILSGTTPPPSPPAPGPAPGPPPSWTGTPTLPGLAAVAVAAPPPQAAVVVLGKGGRWKVRAKGLVATVSCGTESCAATAGGTISGPRSRRSFKLRTAGARVAAGAEGRLRLNLSKSALGKIRRALRHRKLFADVTVDVRFDSGATTAVQRKLQLRR